MIIDVHTHLCDPSLVFPEEPDKFKLVYRAVKHMLQPISPELYFKHKEEAKIDKTVIFGVDSIDNLFPDYRVWNDYIASLVDQYPDIFIGFIAVDPRREQEAIKEIERGVKIGLLGVKLLTGWDYYIDDPRFYPFYEKIREYSLPIIFHGGSGPPGTYLKYTKPEFVDKVAVDFPETTIIIAHMGKPWADEAIRVARKNPNVFLDISAWDDLYRRRPLHFIETLLKAKSICGLEKILFGSDWPLFLGSDPTRLKPSSERMTLKKWVDVVKNLQTPDILKQLGYSEITEKDKQMILHENAAKILRP